MLSSRITFSNTVETATALDADTIAEAAYQSECADRAYDVELLNKSVLVFTHIVTLINRSTSDEKSLIIETLSDRFADVMREITYQKAMQGLLGYEVFEILDCNAPF